MPLPKVVLILHKELSPFHFSIPYMIFKQMLPHQPLFDFKIASEEVISQQESHITVRADGDLSLIDQADIVIISGWHDLDENPSLKLITHLKNAHKNGAYIVGLCYGAYALAYSGLLDNKKAATHWLAITDFISRFPNIFLDTKSLYVEDNRLVTSAGIAAGIDCCLAIVRKFYHTNIVNEIAKLMIIATHREGHHAQYIKKPIADQTKQKSVQDLLVFLRENSHQTYPIDVLAEKISVSRRTFTRQFKEATGTSYTEWLVNERIEKSLSLLENSNLSIEHISDLLGFSSSQIFRTAFKNIYQTSPNDWRKYKSTFTKDVPNLI